jgi:hypothetical protein
MNQGVERGPTRRRMTYGEMCHGGSTSTGPSCSIALRYPERRNSLRRRGYLAW